MKRASKVLSGGTQWWTRSAYPSGWSGGLQSSRIEVCLELMKGLDKTKEEKDTYSSKKSVEGAGEERGETDLREY